MKNSVLILMALFLWAGSSWAQDAMIKQKDSKSPLVTTLLDPTGDGGFENGATFADNNWFVVNHTTNRWYVGAGAVPYAGTKCGYISNDGGVTNAYTTTVTETSHFYRDFAVPAGESKITLTFWLKGSGYVGQDRLLVYTAPTSLTPVAGVPASTSTTLDGATLIYAQPAFFTPYTLQTVVFTGQPGTTFRLIFTWQCQAWFSQIQPPASVDNISLVSDNPGTIASTALGGLWNSPATWVGGVVPAGDNVTITAGADVVVNQTVYVGDLTVDGTLQWTSTPNPSAAVNPLQANNITVSANGRLLAHGTPVAYGGATVKVTGNFTNNGFANFAGFDSGLWFNGMSGTQTLGGTGTFLADESGRGMFYILRFVSMAACDITTSQNLVTKTFIHTGTSLNTNGKVAIDNTAICFGGLINRSITSVIVNTMGAGYTSAPTVTFGLAPEYGTTATGVANYDAATGTVRSITITNPGDGYRTAPAVTLTGGGATTQATAVAVLYQNFNFSVSSLASKSPLSTISGGLTIKSEQSVSTVFVTNGGRGYFADPPTVGFSLPTNFLNLVTAGGSGYTAAPTVVFTGGGGSGAAATAVVTRGQVISVNITNGGTGYTSIPTISFTGGGGGSGAAAAIPAGALPTATANIDPTNYMVVSFTVTNGGFGYAANPTVTLTGGDPEVAASGATAYLALYAVQFGLFAPNTTNAIQGESVLIPPSRRFMALYVMANSTVNLTSDLELYGQSPITLTGILDMGGNTITFSHPGHTGSAGSATGYVTNGYLTYKLFGSTSSQTRQFPFNSFDPGASNNHQLSMGSAANVATEGSTITTLTVSVGAAPTGTDMIGTRTLRIQANGLYGTNPTLRMNWNSADALSADVYYLTIAQATATSGPWTIRSVTSGMGIYPTGNRTTATTGVGPVVMTGDDYFGWNYPAPACLAPSGQASSNFTYVGADLSWVGTASFFDIFIDVVGAPAPVPGTTPTIDNYVGNSYTWTGGTMGGYTWYVRSDCEAGGGTGQSYWLGPNTFYTNNNLCGLAYPILCGEALNGTTVGSTIDVVPACTAAPTAGGVWYKFVGTGDVVSASLCTGTTYNSKLSVYQGSCGSLICVDGNDDYCSTQSRVDWFAESGITYYILVHGTSTNTGAFTLTMGCTSPATSTWVGGDLSTGDSNPQYNWFGADNWSPADVPGVATNVVVPFLGASTFYPIVTRKGVCNNISVASDARLVDRGTGNLTHYGTATVARNYTGGEWHLISSPISNATANMFLDLYLQMHTESTNAYSDITNPAATLNVMQGYALWNDLAGTATFVGTLNTGNIGTPNNVTGNGQGWNLVGNPYPSNINWTTSAGWTKTNVDNATYRHVNNATWASYVNGVGTNGGTAQIPVGQGFFVHVTTGQTVGTLNINNTARTVAAATFYKDEIADIVRLEVSGNGYTDETVIRFVDEASPAFDVDWDAYKLFGSVDEAPAIYSTENDMMSINALPATNAVPVGVKAGVPGEFTITATETSEFPVVMLEDLLSGVVTDLKSKSYTFYYDMNLDNRFIVHFTPLAVTENPADLISIYSSQKDVYVSVPANTRGDIVVYNLMGQEVARTLIKGTLNKIGLSKSAYYVVKVMSNESVVTKKVFVK